MDVMVSVDIMQKIDQFEALLMDVEPQVRAFVPEERRFERLRKEAQDLLERNPDLDELPPLFGILAGVKDIFHVSGIATQAGSRLPLEVLQGPEAECVTRLKDAGVLIVGKTVTTEFAYFAPGPTRNPHHPEYTPGGSSSGSAAAVGAGLCDLALGHQTIGSVVRPAAFCGVLGLKPSYDRISREGMIPLSPSLDHVGVFSPDVVRARQAAMVLYRDWRLVPHPQRRPVLGIPDGPYLKYATEEGLVHFQATCQRLEMDDYKIRRVDAMPDFEDIYRRHYLIMTAEAARVHAAWFKEYGHLYAPITAELVRRGWIITDREVSRALGGRVKLRAELTELMDKNEIDLWITPPAPGPAPRGLKNTGDPVMNLPWAHAGLPAINLPAGKNRAGLPMGLQVVGRWYGDEVLLVWAEGLEHSLKEKLTTKENKVYNGI